MDGARRQTRRLLGLPYVYLGYWVDGSRKMAYKTRFQPLEALGMQGWTEMTPSAGNLNPAP